MSEDLWKVMSDQTRRSILEILRSGPSTTGAIAAEFDISRIAVMRHLEVLSEAMLVTSEKRGRERWHFLNATPLVSMLRSWLGPFDEPLAGSLLDLKEVAEMSVDPAIDLRFEVFIEASPAVVFESITKRPGAWWSRDFLDPRAVSLALEPRLGGQFIEEWEDGGQILATVVELSTNRSIRLQGPFHLGGGDGSAHIQLEPTNGGTTVALHFVAFGPVPAPMRRDFPNGWQTLISTLLKQHAETGEVVGIDKEGT